jgi:hypothetical protein
MAFGDSGQNILCMGRSLTLSVVSRPAMPEKISAAPRKGKSEGAPGFPFSRTLAKAGM